jgi:WD40 repeat protein
VPLTGEEIERAIDGPAERVGATPELALVAEMVADVSERPGALPLLQFALTELFERRRGSAMTLEAYRQIGGVSGALARRAEELYDGLNREGRRAAKQIFLRLVTVGEGIADTRRLVPRTELLSLPIDRGAVEGVIELFGRHRLLAFDRDPTTRGPTVEVGHEALLGSWDHLRIWIDEARTDLLQHRRLLAVVREWEASGRDPGLLPRGRMLEEMTSWAGSSELELSQDERDFVSAGVRQRDEEQSEKQAREERERALERRSVLRLRALVAMMTAAALVATALTAVALRQRSVAQESSRVASARELAEAATANIDNDADRSLLLALAAVETTYRVDGIVIREAEQALHTALQAHRLLFSVPGNEHVDFSADGERMVVGDREGGVRVYDAATGAELLTVRDPGAAEPDVAQHDVAFSPDGSTFASSSGMVWDSVTGEPLQHLTLGFSFSIAYSPDGDLLASQAPEGGTGVWDLETGELVGRFDAYGSVAFSRDGRRLLIADNYGEPDPALGQIAGYVVDLRREEGSNPVTLFGHQDTSTRGAVWSPDGSMVATSAGPEVLVWDPTTAERKYSLTASARFESVAFSPDSRGLATGMADGTAIVWRLGVDGAEQVLTVAGHDALVTGIAFSPDGRKLATASVDGTVHVWDVTPKGDHEWITVPGAQGLAYSPDGRMLATTSTVEDQTGSATGAADVHLWDTETGAPLGTLRGHKDEIIALDFAPDGDKVVSASLDGTARIWDVAGQGSALVLDDRIPARAPPFVVAVAFSPDGNKVATSHSEGGHIRLWDASNGEPLTTLRDEEGKPVQGNWSEDFSPDGTLFAAPSDDNLYVWEVGTGRVVEHLNVPGLSQIAFTVDGRRLIGTSGDGVLRVWDTRTWKAEAAIEAGAGDIQVSPIGNRAATVDADGTVRLWRIHPLRELIVVSQGLGGYVGPQAMSFSPDGERLAVDVGDNVRVYALNIDALIDLARDRVTRRFTYQECRQYLHVGRCPTR